MSLEIVTYKSDATALGGSTAEFGGSSASSSEKVQAAGKSDAGLMDLTRAPEPKLKSERGKTSRRSRTKSAQ